MIFERIILKNYSLSFPLFLSLSNVADADVHRPTRPTTTTTDATKEGTEISLD